MMDHLAPSLRAQYRGDKLHPQPEPAMDRPRETPDQETLSRVRRIETRLTQLMIGLGVTTRVEKPVFDTHRRQLAVPSVHSSLKEILDSLPAGCSDPVELVIGNSQVVVLRIEAV